MAVLASISGHVLAGGAATILLPRLLVAERAAAPIEVELATALATVDSKPADAPATNEPAVLKHTTAKHLSLPLRSRPAVSATATAPQAEPALSSETQRQQPMRFHLAAGVAGTVAVPAGPATVGHPATTATAVRGDVAVEPVYAESQVSAPAKAIDSVSPRYPEEARRAEVEGDVVLEIVVGTDGRVLDARSLSRRGYGLDEAALAAIRACRFSPALRDGRAVRVRMRWTIQFRLSR